MINLLPPHIKKERRYEALNRQTMFVGELSFAVLVLLCGLLLVEVWFAESESKKISQRIAGVLERAEARQTNQFQQDLQIFRKEVDRLNLNQAQKPDTFHLMQKIIQRIPRRILMTHLSVDMPAKQALLSGVAATRSDLLALKSAIEDGGVFHITQFPLANLLQENDIKFSISLAFDQSPSL
ncbi:MAG: hypothetical protein Q8Q39_05415 [bacterium]|nr:hypothetical protein [bacterium]